MIQGDVVRITGKVDSRIKDAPDSIVGTLIELSGNIAEVLMSDGVIYRVKLKDVAYEKEKAV